MSRPNIIVLDLETAPAEVYSWGLRDQNHGIEQIKHDQYCLMWVAKEVGSKEVKYDTLINHPTEYRKDHRSDKEIAKSLRDVLDECDIVVTQNGDNFDLKWANNLFLKHDIDPPKPFYSVDLLKESRRRYFSLSHRLDFRGRQLGLGGKKEHEGFRLWLRCMAGDKKAWARMLAYCIRDVKLTEQYYLKLRPHMKSHPNVNMFREQPFGGRLRCPICSSTNLKAKGFRYTNAGRKQRFKCANCGHYTVEANRPDSITRTILRSE